MPKRIQRKRTKGWRMPRNTVSVTRPGRWGNCFPIGREYECLDGSLNIVDSVQHSLEAYRHWAIHCIGVEEIKRHLMGKNLACFCPLDQPCHADILLELANQ